MVGHRHKALPIFLLWLNSILQWQFLHYVTVFSRENHRHMLLSVFLLPLGNFHVVRYLHLQETCKLFQLMCATFYYTGGVLSVRGGFNTPEITLSFHIQIAILILLKYHQKTTVWICTGKPHRPTNRLPDYLNYLHTSPWCYVEPTWPHKQPVIIGRSKKYFVCRSQL